VVHIYETVFSDRCVSEVEGLALLLCVRGEGHVEVSACRLAILIEVSHGYPQFLQANIEVMP
jgi:hypothetical protein